MRRSKLILAITLIIISFIFSCTKSSTLSTPSTVTSLNIINTVNGSSGLIANINNQLPYYSNQISVYYGGYQLHSFGYGNTSLQVRDASDTTKNLFASTMDLQNYSVHSLFLTGTIEAPDSLFTTDSLPYHGGAAHALEDSTAGIRFVNLSPGSNPIKVIISGGLINSEIDNLAYKNITGFGTYATTFDISTYNFEFRDAVTDDSLTTFVLPGVNNGTNGNTDVNNVRFRNLTIVFYGLPGSQNTFLVNNY